jgi:hypothetical protein
MKEVWMEKTASLHHLLVFFCEAYAHVPKDNWSKLFNKVVKCIFIGSSVGVKGYKIWDPVIGKVLYSRNVIFIEVKSSPTMAQLEEDEKNLVVQLPPKIEKIDPKSEHEFYEGPDEEEGLESS